MTAQENLTTIEPVNGPLVGSISVPGDKSISHRAVLFRGDGRRHLAPFGACLILKMCAALLAAVSKLGAR